MSRGGPSKARTLSTNGVSNRLYAGGFTRHQSGTSGYSVERDRSPGVVQVWHLGPAGEVLDAGPLMQEWGRQLARAGFTVHVAEDTHLLVTLPDGAAAGATRAVERAA